MKAGGVAELRRGDMHYGSIDAMNDVLHQRVHPVLDVQSTASVTCKIRPLQTLRAAPTGVKSCTAQLPDHLIASDTAGAPTCSMGGPGDLFYTVRCENLRLRDTVARAMPATMSDAETRARKLNRGEVIWNTVPSEWQIFLVASEARYIRYPTNCGKLGA